MNNERWIKSSRQVYARLLRLYPREHYEEYGLSMSQVFGDQCRDACERSGGWGLTALWLRTMADLLVSAAGEHISTPNAGAGLLEAIPGSPVPWKGVLLVLLPGPVFLVGQINQVTSGDLFFSLARWAAYFLILPVVLVWVWRRKFPLWGLIPLGMFAKNLFELIYRFQVGQVRNNLPVWTIFAHFAERFRGQLQVASDLIFLVVMAWLIVSLLRGQKLRRAKIWLGGFFLVCLAQILFSFVFTIAANNMVWADVTPSFMKGWFGYLFYWNSYFAGGYLLVILCSALLSRRFGALALLLPLGYMVPIVLFGRYSDSYMPASLIYWILPAVLIYRLLTTLLAPLWMSRAASPLNQKRAFALTLGTAVAVQTVLNIAVTLTYASGYHLQPFAFFSMVVDQVVAALGIGLLLALCQPNSYLLQAEPGLAKLPEELAAN